MKRYWKCKWLIGVAYEEAIEPLGVHLVVFDWGHQKSEYVSTFGLN